MKTLKEVLTEYKSLRRALPAFNIDSFEIYQAVEKAVKLTSLPCIAQLSANEDQFIEAERLYLLVKKAQIDGLPIYLNMDHGQDLSRLEKLSLLGFDMVHFDGSKEDYATCLSKTTGFIKHLRSICPDIVVEAEFNHINLIENGVSPDSFTNPEQAKEFVSETGADLLAVSIGNMHGVNPEGEEHIDLALFHQIKETLPDTFFTLHGGSGIDIGEVTAAINLGIVKININTDLRLCFKQSLGNNWAQINSEKLYDYFTPVIDDVAKVMVKKLTDFSNISS
jgi:fructose-bisphosphate aldolase class II